MNFRKQLQTGLILFLFLNLTSFTSSDTSDLIPPPFEGFIWHDLVTPDMDQSKAFYSTVFGWEFREVQSKGLRVATVYAGSVPIAGVIEVPTANTAVWIKAVFVDDVKERINMVERQGGNVLLPPAKIPGRGMQVIMESASGEEFSFIGHTEGTRNGSNMDEEHHWIWSELWSDDPEASRVFYEGVFGVSTDTRESGNNPYWVFTAQEYPLAGMIQNPITNQGTQWVPYVQSKDPSGIVGKAEAAGAFVVLGPTPEVREGRVGVFQDPQGALICVQNKN